MSKTNAFLLLALAALLVAGGDALVRNGLKRPDLAPRVALIVIGGLVLTLYGVVVNSPPWDFGRLLGVYVVLFFVVAQVLNLVTNHVRPDASVLIGGALIISGGLLITVWRPQ